MQATDVKAMIHDNGDPSVGIFAQGWQVDCPFCKEDIDSEGLEYFREELRKLYYDFANGKIIIRYDFEIAAEEAAYAEFEKQIEQAERRQEEEIDYEGH